ncbi:hypothetical protein CK203_027639 [Vitis vinifera]|uniref:Uncharacterized protein n=1 Tax=Vitis vinifera TaxID=29760 RepID=A0A438IH54_VITVI|nr:hypothetical protein CK203_027639 [Vitis vinifera]
MGQSFSTSRSHPDTATHILSLEIGDFDVRRILVDPGSSADLVQASVVGHMGHSLTGLENPGRILSGFNGLQLHPWETLYCRSKRPVTLNVQFSVVQELSPFNVILGRTWLHYMKAIPSTYHQMVSFSHQRWPNRPIWQPISRSPMLSDSTEAGANQEDASPPEPSIAHDQ